MNPEYPLLNCLVLSKQREYHTLISAWLGESARVGGVTAVSDEHGLIKHQSKAQVHFCIVVLDKDDQTLPVSFVHNAKVPVLVLTSNRKPGKLKKLIFQGAIDVVSMHKPSVAQHAINRVVSECDSTLKQRFLKTRIEQLENEVAYLKAMLKSDKRSFALTAANDAKHSMAGQVEAQLKRMQQPVVENIINNYKPRDTATGLLARISVLKRFQHMLTSQIKAPRFTALLVSILADESKEAQSGAAKNVQDLTLYRAADILKKRLNTGTVLGRINQNALLLILSSEDEPVSRDAANRVKHSLGSLGGLIDVETDVHINTMNLPADTSISANEVVARLEASAH